jgi:hypothetical protein
MHSAVIAMLVGNLFTSIFERGPNFGSGSYANYFWLTLGILTAIRTKDIEL